MTSARTARFLDPSAWRRGHALSVTRIERENLGLVRDRTTVSYGQPDCWSVRFHRPSEEAKKEEPDAHGISEQAGGYGYVTNSKVPIKLPAPCVQCDGVAFKVVNK
jgi:hypothetical protein